MLLVPGGLLVRQTVPGPLSPFSSCSSALQTVWLRAFLCFGSCSSVYTQPVRGSPYSSPGPLTLVPISKSLGPLSPSAAHSINAVSPHAPRSPVLLPLICLKTDSDRRQCFPSNTGQLTRPVSWRDRLSERLWRKR